MRDQSDGENGEAFLSRWSRRKREAAAEATPARAENAPRANEIAAPALTDADMPPIDSLGANSDFSGFLSEGVSKELRELALRKLFSLPQFSQLDGLNDYDEDFTKLEPLGNTITYQMHQWMARDAERARAEAEAAEAAAPAQIAAADATGAGPAADTGEAAPADAAGAADEDPSDAGERA